MDVIEIEKVDEAYNKLKCDPGIAYELNDHFTFEVPGAKFMPAVRNKFWDGKIRLYNVMSGHIYAGLNKYVEETDHISDNEVLQCTYSYYCSNYFSG